MDLHNRTTAVALVATALVVVLAGFGCDSDRVPPVGDLPAAGGITRWTSYTSPTLGITIPYPEGWRVETEANGDVRFHDSAPPSADSEDPATMWMDSFSGSVDDFLAQFRSGDVLERSEVTRSGKTMQRVVLRHDLYGTAVSYIWTEGGMTRRVGGQDGEALEYVVDHLGVAP